MNSRCIQQLCDPDACTAADAIRLAREVSRVEPELAQNLGAFVLSPAAAPRARRRAVELLAAISDSRAFRRLGERIAARCSR